MPNEEDLRWLKSTANELNNLLQLIAESRQGLERLLPASAEAEKYLEILRSSTERAERVSQAIVARAGGSGPAPAAISAFPSLRAVAAPASASPALAAVPSPLAAGNSDGPTRLEIHNPGGSRELVLIVDDEEFITMLAQQVLTDEGYRVVTAKNGFQAIDIYKKLKDEVALVVLDFVMPVMDGADVFAELQLINPDVPVVLSSGFAEQDRLRGMLARGLRGFIPKPYTQQKLLDQIRQTLDALHAEK